MQVQFIFSWEKLWHVHFRFLLICSVPDYFIGRSCFITISKAFKLIGFEL